MRSLVIAVMLLGVCAAFGAAQDKTTPRGEYDVQRCAPKVMSEHSRKSPETHFHKGEKYGRSPVVAFEILASGEIAQAVLKRGSGVTEADNYALKWVQGLKYNERPGCRVVESQVVVTIDFR